MNRIDRRTYLVAVAGGVLTVAGCAENGAETEPTATPEPDENETPSAEFDERAVDEPAAEESPAEPDHVAAVGDALELGDLRLVVADVERTDEYTAADATHDAAEGTAFEVLDLAVRYDGDEPVIDLDDHLEVALVDGAGEAFDLIEASDAEFDDSGVAESRLAPGEVVRGDLVYGIDDDAAELELEIDSAAGEAAVDLEEAVEEPEVLEQEPNGDVLGFSEGVELAGTEVTVTSLQHGNNLGGFMQSDEGHEMVAVGVVVENESGRDRTLSAAQVRLTDEFGRSYGEAPRAVRMHERIDGAALTDGEEYRGKIAYQIGEGLSELYWVFDFEPWGEERRVFWKLR